MANYLMEQDSKNINDPNKAPQLEPPVLAAAATVFSLLVSLILFAK